MMETVDEVNIGSRRAFRNPLDPLILNISVRFGGDRAKEFERFLKFAVVGVTGAIVDFGVLIFLQATLLPPDSDLSVFVASSISFGLAVLSNFIWTRLWVYPESRSWGFRKQLGQFAFISVIGGVARAFWISLSYDEIGRLLMPFALDVVHVMNSGYTASAGADEKLGTIIAQMIGMVVVMLWNFFANRYWTYRAVD
jgi:putative flippase GtrA